MPYRSKTRRNRRTRATCSGLTLAELLTALAIVGVLAVLAVPGYRMQVLRSHRIEATSALLAVAAAQEKFYLQNNSYSATLTAAPPAGLGLQDTTPGGFYSIAILHADSDEFTATAAATGSQAADTHCAEFSIRAPGVRAATHADCWSR